MSEYVSRKGIFTNINSLTDVLKKPETFRSCRNCEEEFMVNESTRMYSINNKLLCKSCVTQKYLQEIDVEENEDIIFCDICCKEIDDIESYVINKQTMCKQCFDDEYFDYVC